MILITPDLEELYFCDTAHLFKELYLILIYDLCFCGSVCHSFNTITQELVWLHGNLLHMNILILS